MSTFKEYLKSSIITFVASFALTISTAQISMGKGAIVSLLLVAVRTGIKAVLEYLATLKK